MNFNNLALIIPTWNYETAYRRVVEARKLEHRGRSSATILISGVEPESIGEPNPDGLDLLHPGVYRTRLSPVEAMKAGAEHVLKAHPETDLLFFLHDDVELLDKGWDDLLINHFRSSPRSGLAGFGGAEGLGTRDIYKTPYRLPQLVRRHYLSNTSDWRDHGDHLVNPTQVSVLDGFSLCFRADAYRKMGGWDAALLDGIHFHMYDAWAGCRMKELGWEVWALPYLCHHQGGGTSVNRSEDYEQMVRVLGYESGQDLYNKAHSRIYERFRGVLPLRVPNGESE